MLMLYITAVIIDDEARIKWGDYINRITVSSELFRQLSERNKSRLSLVGYKK